MTVSNSYLPQEGSATPTLAEDLIARIRRNGSMPFSEFMGIALYDPSRGYYAKGFHQVGRAGDFFTSVSVGPLFGGLLARRFLKWWREEGCPTYWRITELGAHTGQLAKDVLDALAALSVDAFETVDYIIVEPLPKLAEAQAVTLNSDYNGKVRILTSVADLAPAVGIVFGNELLDALPFEVVEWREEQWFLGQVTASNERLSWDFSSPWKGVTPEVTANLVEGYRTEIRTNYVNIFQPLVKALDRGLMLWIDYGFAAPEYYHSFRTSGTLRTFGNHRAGNDPFETPGVLDITAHVDFTAVAEAGAILGAIPTLFETQGSWLTKLAADWLRDQEGRPNPNDITQFQTLVHPAHLGARFHVLEQTIAGIVDEKAARQTAHRLSLKTIV